MQLNISTDYAIRTMLFIAQSRHNVSATEIAAAMCVPVYTCKKNLQQLKDAALVASTFGTHGGYTLAKAAHEISMRDILAAVGEETVMNRCLKADCFCNRNAVADCPVHKVYADAQAALDKAFSTTLQDLLQCSKNT